MAAGAIPPPLFFEQRRYGSIWLSGHGILKNTGFKNTLEIQPASITQFERPARLSPTNRAMSAEG
jgi:hypothetical protein